MEKDKCVICGDAMPDIRRTANATPVREGRCCLTCDNMMVTPYRLALAGMKGQELVLNLVKSLQEDDNLNIRLRKGKEGGQ